MKVFLSSTFLDLLEEREAVLEALHKKQVSTLAMEYFVASPNTPLETALDKLRKTDVIVLAIGFKAGSLLPDGSGATYTSAEYDEWIRLGRAPLVFIKTKAQPGQRLPSWCNEEENDDKRAALADLLVRAKTPRRLTSVPLISSRSKLFSHSISGKRWVDLVPEKHSLPRTNTFKGKIRLANFKF